MYRRSFLKYSTALAGVSLIGNSNSWAGANDRVRVAVLGMGGRGGDLMKSASSLAGVEVVALADPDERRVAKNAEELEKATGRAPQRFQDLRKIMDDSTIDAVSIATCNHWHALATIWACQAGKHVYVEKPVSHNIFEGRQMVKAARKYNRVVQGGPQRRSSGLFRKAVQLLREGAIGDIYMSRALVFGARDSIGFAQPKPVPEWLDYEMWLGPAPEQPYHENLIHYNWHWFWDFGNGDLGNNGSHILDVIRWGIQKGLPVKIHSTGGRYGYKDQGQTPNTQIVTYEFDDGTILSCEVRGLYTNPEAHGIRWGGMFYGSKGYLAISDEKYELFLGRNAKPEPDQGVLESEDHYQNFIDAVRAGDPGKLNGEIEQIYLSCAFCLLGNISYRLGREIHFDPATETFPGDEEANRMLTREYRKPFVVPNEV